MQNSPFIEELASVGVHPEEVDFVLCTIFMLTMSVGIPSF